MSSRKLMAAAAVAVMVGALPVSAMQSSQMVAMVGTDTPSEKIDRARELRTKAEQLFSQPKQWRKAVRLLEESAELRTADDPEAYVCLLYAGRIRAALGDYAGARQNLEKAAAQAIARGAVVEAANAYIDAAHAAIEGKEPQIAHKLVSRAQLLIASPLLSAQQRTTLNARLAS